MHRIFRRRHSSTSSDSETLHPRRFSTPEYTEEPRYEFEPDPYDLSPATSAPLSETETLRDHKTQRLELQPTYNENFEHYLPYVLRRLRLQMHEEAFTGDVSLNNDDQPTILEEPIDSGGDLILERDPSSFNYKRSFIIASEFIKGSCYLFPSSDSFNAFRELRSQNKKHRKLSVTTYDAAGKVSVRSRSDSELQKSGTVDPRNHIIPLINKSSGVGLPLFKISVPYMSNFRKGAPFMIFHKYKEVPDPPRFSNGELVEEEFETFPFCTVYTKKFGEFKRYVYEFKPIDSPAFKVIMFQHAVKPFLDFTYKGTRFRILGTSIISAYALAYNPCLKLVLVDEGKPSLCDEMINAKPGGGLLRKKEQAVDYDPDDPQTFPNPLPYPTNPLLTYSSYMYGSLGMLGNLEYVPNELPPFGMFQDSLIYTQKFGLIPKKYSEMGKIDVYESLSTVVDENSTKYVGLDALVLSVILLTMRENSIRATARPTTASFAVTSRLGGVRPVVAPSFNVAL